MFSLKSRVPQLEEIIKFCFRGTRCVIPAKSPHDEQAGSQPEDERTFCPRASTVMVCEREKILVAAANLRGS